MPLLSIAARVAVVAGLLVYGITETLGLFSLLRRETIATAWIVAALLLWRRVPRPAAWSPHGRWFEAACFALVAGIAVVLLVTAIVSPPNSADAMAYHMPRVVYWAQAGNVAFFPTTYFNQVSLPPLAEYFMLHTYLLSGGDGFVNLVQWFGFLGSACGAALVTRSLGADSRMQAFAALFAATIPVVPLQASGAKNELVLATYLLLAAHFLLEGRLFWFAAALGLAVATKSTAYLFAPPLLAVCVWTARRNPLRVAAAAILGILALNMPLYVRNYRLSGSVLGFDSAQGDGKFRWRNDRFGWDVTVSNALRHFSEQMGGRSEDWNRFVYRRVLDAHAALGLDANDPATTWPDERFTPPRNANHEANAPGRWPLAFLAAGVLVACVRRRWAFVWHAAAVLTGYLAYCAFLKWQPFMSRLESPLLLLGAPLAALVFESVRFRPVQAALCVFLLSGARLPLLQNWTRPLTGERSLFATSREENYFRDMSQFGGGAEYFRAANLVARAGCKRVGIDIRRNELEYPMMALLRARVPGVQFVHVPQATGPAPCAVVCLGCGEEGAVAGRILVLI